MNFDVLAEYNPLSAREAAKTSAKEAPSEAENPASASPRPTTPGPAARHRACATCAARTGPATSTGFNAKGGAMKLSDPIKLPTGAFNQLNLTPHRRSCAARHPEHHADGSPRSCPARPGFEPPGAAPAGAITARPAARPDRPARRPAGEGRTVSQWTPTSFTPSAIPANYSSFLADIGTLADEEQCPLHPRRLHPEPRDCGAGRGPHRRQPRRRVLRRHAFHQRSGARQDSVCHQRRHADRPAGRPGQPAASGQRPISMPPTPASFRHLPNPARINLRQPAPGTTDQSALRPAPLSLALYTSEAR